MAKQISYSSDDGVTHPVSYWLPRWFALDLDAQTARVVFRGFRNAALRVAKARAIGEKAYDIGPARFPTYFGAGLPIFANLYQLAVDTKDVGESSPGANDGLSFFNGATDV